MDDSKSQMIESKSFYQDTPKIQDSSHFSNVKSERTETNVGKNLNELDILLKELNTSPGSGAPGDSRTTPRRERVHTIETRMEKNSRWLIIH